MVTAYPTTSGVRFKKIVEREGYCVGDDGSVWSCWTTGANPGPRGQWRQLKPYPQSKGHCVVSIGRKNTRFVHRLILEAFVGPCPEGMECRHLDGDPGNNRLENLAWGTPEENHADSVRHGTAYSHSIENMQRLAADSPDKPWNFVKHKAGEKHHRAKLSDEQVRIIRQMVDTSRRDGTASRLAKEWGVTSATVMMIAKGLRRCSG